MKQELLRLLDTYHTTDQYEAEMLKQTRQFVATNPGCFDRSLLIGHVTGSAWILDPGYSHTLLVHHAKLDKWLQPGGHCDGDPDVLKVAAKEAFEETGLAVRAVSRHIFDVDVHRIPERRDVPAHLHYDIRFLFVAEMAEEDLVLNKEVKALKWIHLSDVHLYNNEPSVLRMVEKCNAFVKA